MRSATTNSDVVRTCESKMRESGRTIGWFEESLRELEGRLGAGRQQQQQQQDPRMRNLPPPPPGAAPSYVGQEGYAGGERRTEGGGDQAVDVVGPKPKVVYTSLGTFLLCPGWHRVDELTPGARACRPHQGRYPAHVGQDLSHASPARVQAARRTAVQGRDRQNGQALPRRRRQEGAVRSPYLLSPPPRADDPPAPVPTRRTSASNPTKRWFSSRKRSSGTRPWT